MSLIDEFMTKCCFVNVSKVSDGAGGFIETITDGAQFDAAITRDTTLEAAIADLRGEVVTYKVTTHQNCILSYDDKIKRLSDGKMFRIKSDGSEKRTPASSPLNLSRVEAERWRP